jgi:hypothetical protein
MQSTIGVVVVMNCEYYGMRMKLFTMLNVVWQTD